MIEALSLQPLPAEAEALRPEVRAFLDQEAGRPGAAVMARNGEAMQRGALQSGEATH